MVWSANKIKKWSLFEGDKVIWIILMFLAMVSIVEVYSASSNMSYKTGAYWKPVLQHASYLLVGIVATLVIHKIHCRYFKLIPVFGLPLSVLLLIVTMFTEKVNNASRWFEYAGITFQPSELAKGVLVAATAMILSSMRDEAGAQKRAFNYILCITLIICGLIAPELLNSSHDIPGHSDHDVYRRYSMETVGVAGWSTGYCCDQFFLIPDHGIR